MLAGVAGVPNVLSALKQLVNLKFCVIFTEQPFACKRFMVQRDRTASLCIHESLTSETNVSVNVTRGMSS